MKALVVATVLLVSARIGWASTCSLHLTTEAETVTSGMNTAGDRLARELAAAFPNGDLNISPLILVQALQMLYLGNGALASNLARLLGLDALSRAQALEGLRSVNNKLNEGADTKLATSMSLWTNSGQPYQINKNYLRDLAVTFTADARALNFSDPVAVRTINGYVAGKTDQMVLQILSQLEPRLNAVLISTLFIEGTWRHKFNDWSTRSMPFTSDTHGPTNVDMMLQLSHLEYAQDENFQIVRLPTDDGRAVMDIYLPLGTDGRAKFFNHDFKDTLSPNEVRLYLPRGRILWQDEVTDSLAKMLPLTTVPFVDDLTVTRVIHAAALEIRETGFRGAAATAMLAIASGAPAQTKTIEMNVNRSYGVRVLFMDQGRSLELFRTWVDEPQALTAEGGGYMD